MFTSDHFSSNHVAIKDTDYLFFSGTSYLGMNHNAAFRNHIVEGMERYGSSYGSSRSSNFRLQVYDEAEEYLAMFTGAPAALTLSSGYMAGQLVINAFRNSLFFIYAPDTHPAVCRTPEDFYTGDFSSWSESITKQVEQAKKKDIAIVCNAVDPLRCNVMDFDWVKSLPSGKTITLIVDDSHGLGVTGENGSGIYKKIVKPDHIKLIVVSSLAKAMGIPGGVVLCDANTKSFLQQTAAYSSASPAAPASLYAFLKSIDIFSEARQKLQENIKHFKQLLQQPGLFTSLPAYPVFYTPENRLPLFLAEKKILISSFAYPKTDGKIISRIILNSNHTPEDISTLTDAICAFAGGLNG